MNNPLGPSSQPRAVTGRSVARLSPLWVAAALALFVAVFAAHLDLTPVSPFLDEGDHANTARLLMRGGAMYRDAFNEKGPGLYWVGASLFAVFGDRFVVLRHAATAGMLAALVLLLGLGALEKRPWTGWLAALAFAAWHLLFLGKFWESESLLTPLSLAVIFLLRSKDGERPAVRRFALAGVALFEMTCVKQTSWTLVAAMALLLVWPRVEPKPRARDTLAFAAGLLIPWGLILAAVGAGGYLREFWHGYWFPFTDFGVGDYADGPLKFEWPIELPIVFMAAAALMTCRPRRRWEWPRAIWFAVTAGVIGMLSPALFVHHFLPVLALAAWGFFAFALDPRFVSPARRRALVAGASLLCLVALPFVPTQWHHRVGVFGTGARDVLVEEIRERTRPDQPILVFPHDSMIYFLADREPPGRLGFLLPWTAPPPVLAEFMDEFRRRSPALVAYVFLDNLTPNGTQPCSYLEPLCVELASCYALDRITPENDVLLARRDSCVGPDSDAACAVRAILHTDPNRMRHPPGWLQARVEDVCAGLPAE